MDDNFVLKEVPQGEIFLILQLNTITYNKIYKVLFLFEALYSSYFYKSSFSILIIFIKRKILKSSCSINIVCLYFYIQLFIQFISRIFALTMTLLIFSLTLEDTIGHLPSDEIDYVIKHPPVPSLTPANELESLDYPDQRSKLQKLQEKLSPESPVSSPSLTSQGRTSISPDTKSMSFVFESSPTPDTMTSEWSSQWSEDVQMPRSCSNSTINIPSRGKNKT